jgi:hypothetical protein
MIAAGKGGGAHHGPGRETTAGGAADSHADDDDAVRAGQAPDRLPARRDKIVELDRQADGQPGHQQWRRRAERSGNDHPSSVSSLHRRHVGAAGRSGRREQAHYRWLKTQ